jgi:hypothetical protein
MRFFLLLLMVALVPGCHCLKLKQRDSVESSPSSAPPQLRLKSGVPYVPKTDEVWANQQDFLDLKAEVLKLRATYQ